jgi:pyruvate dehydrogenase complex dehydrogenase (E1) component
MKPGVDDLEASVTKGSRDYFGSTIVAVKTGFGDYDSVRALHQHFSIDATLVVRNLRAARSRAR